MSEHLQLIIPAAGAGTRFRNAGFDVPKPLIEISGIPMLIWVICNFAPQPDDHIVIVGQEKDQLPEKLKEYLELLKCDVSFVEIEGLTKGPAATVELAIPFIKANSPVIVANSDQFVSTDFSTFLNEVRAGQSDGNILTMIASGEKWSYIGRDSAGRINKVVEKKQISDEATVGIYAWSNLAILQESISYLRDKNITVNNEFYIAPSYQFLIEESLSINTFPVGNHGDSVHGLGTPEDLAHFLLHNDFTKFYHSVISNLGKK